jgi:hypothetical protein
MSNPQQPYQPPYPDQPGQPGQQPQYGEYAQPFNTPQEGSYAPPSEPQPPQPQPQPWSPYQEQPGAYSPGLYGQPQANPNPYAPPQTPNPYAPPGAPNSFPPPGAPPPMMGYQGQPGGTNLNFQRMTLPENRLYLIAACGGLVALLSFFAFSYYGYSGSGFSASASGTYFAGTLGYGGLWLMVIGALAAIAVSGLLGMGSTAFPQLNARNGAITLIASGGVGLLMLLWVFFGFNSGGLGSWGFGFFLTFLGMCAVLGAGIQAYRRLQMQPPTLPPNIPPYQGPRY